MKQWTPFQRRNASLAALVLALPGAGLLAGCGGSSSSRAPAPTGSAPVQAHGSAAVIILWPKVLPQTPMVHGHLVPAAAQSIVIAVTGGGKPAAPSQTLARPMGGGPDTATFTGLPTGTLTVTATAYPSANGIGTAQASASAPVTVQADQSSPVTTLSLSSTIASLTLPQYSSPIALGKTLALTATALDGAGSVVMTVPGQFQWSSSAPSVATVDANGVITAVSQGSASVTALDTESHQTATAAVSAVFPAYTLQKQVPLHGDLLAIDSSGNLYERGFQNLAIVKAAPDGTVLQTFSIPVSLLALDGAGNLYVIASGATTLQKFDARGSHLLDFSTTGPGRLTQTTWLTVDTQGNVFVTDGTSGAPSVKKYNSQGQFVLQFGSAGAGNGQFGIPYRVGTDAAGNVYVLDTVSSNRVERFDNQGNYLSQFPVGAFTLAVDPSGNVYTGGSKYSPMGTLLATFNVSPIPIRFADYLLVDAQGNIYQEIFTGASNSISLDVYAPP